MFKQMMWLAIAGAVGTLSRYGLTSLVQRVAGGKFPWGTLVVNLVGCFCFGLVWAIAEQRVTMAGQLRLIMLGGFMAAFTTFSTYAYDTGAMLRDAQWWLAAGNLCAHNLLGLLCVFLGLALGRHL